MTVTNTSILEDMKDEKNNFTIHPIPVLIDNIVWIWQVGKRVIVVDPSLSGPIKSWIKENNFTLDTILQTHHHSDHIGGTPDLLKSWPSASVIASKADFQRIPFQSYSVIDQDELEIMGYQIKVIGVPGHTYHHIAYYLYDPKNSQKNPVLFCGDTLFGGGCGRLFEGTAKEMFTSLERLNSLPPETKIYCAHEYTEANLRWANSLYPNDLSIQTRLNEVIKKRSEGILSLPSSLAEERETNLFLRAKNVSEFSKLRNHKDRWNG